MQSQTGRLEKVRDAAGAVCAAHGLALVDARFVQQRGTVLQVLIERPGTDPATGAGVSLMDCQAVSRDLSVALDVEGAGAPGGRYRLEVGSPGLERPLLSPDDFARFSGREVRVTAARPVDGRRKFSGTLLGTDAAGVRIEVDGAEVRIAHDNLQKAHLVHRF